MGDDPSHSQAKVYLCRNCPMEPGSPERRSRDTGVWEGKYPLESESESAVGVDKQEQTKRT